MPALIEIAKQIARAPTGTGCYIWKNDKGDILYVGKAINLRSRLRNYLGSDAPEKTVQMRSQAASVEWITT
ncbi:MAG: nucleotide excision repair endonuclease, partial [Spirochaetia bacterium]|nr:nucleotide excision repair endonuclease [Spirochaetia bacterium]